MSKTVTEEPIVDSSIVASEAPADSTEGRIVLTPEQYVELKSITSAQQEIQGRAYPILKEKVNVEAYLTQINAQLTQAEEQLAQLNDGLRGKFAEFMAPYGLENASVQVSDTEPHVVTVTDPQTGQPLAVQPTV